MLEKLPSFIGKALEGVRPGVEKVVAVKSFGDVPETIAVESPDFGHGAALPRDTTEDGAKVSPPISWANMPSGTAEVVLVVEDADSPTPEPLVHALVYGLEPDGQIAGSALAVGNPGLGENSFGKAGWLPPDPPSGHGPHRYVFQVFALGRPSGLSGTPGRRAVVAALEGKVSSKGVLIGTYERP